MKRLYKAVFVAALAVCGSTGSAAAEEQLISLERAEGEGLAAAIGHYARARSLLLAAVQEFDRGLKLANPQALIDVHEWRNDLLDRAEDLERVVDPQPRVTEGGVKFHADTRLLHEAQR